MAAYGITIGQSTQFAPTRGISIFRSLAPSLEVFLPGFHGSSVEDLRESAKSNHRKSWSRNSVSASTSAKCSVPKKNSVKTAGRRRQDRGAVVPSATCISMPPISTADEAEVSQQSSLQKQKFQDVAAALEAVYSGETEPRHMEVKENEAYMRFLEQFDITYGSAREQGKLVETGGSPSSSSLKAELEEEFQAVTMRLADNLEKEFLCGLAEEINHRDSDQVLEAGLRMGSLPDCCVTDSFADGKSIGLSSVDTEDRSGVTTAEVLRQEDVLHTPSLNLAAPSTILALAPANTSAVVEKRLLVRSAGRGRRRHAGLANLDRDLQMMVEELQKEEPGLEISPQEVQSLVRRYGKVSEFGSVTWQRLKNDFLSREEENRTAILMKPGQKAHLVRNDLAKKLGREPSESEWASACSLSVAALNWQIFLQNAAKNKLVQHNLQLVKLYAKKYSRRDIGISFLDLCQAGVHGLARGADKYDPSVGTRFTTYGGLWVKSAILRAITTGGFTISAPAYIGELNYKIIKTELEMTMELGRPPSAEEVAKALKIQNTQYQDVKRASCLAESLHSTLELTGVQKISVLSDPDSEVEEPDLDEAHLKAVVDNVLEKLRPKARIVLKERFGLDGSGCKSAIETGNRVGMSRAVVYKYEKEGMMRMRHSELLNLLRRPLAAASNILLSN